MLAGLRKGSTSQILKRPACSLQRETGPETCVLCVMNFCRNSEFTHVQIKPDRGWGKRRSHVATGIAVDGLREEAVYESFGSRFECPVSGI